MFIAKSWGQNSPYSLQEPLEIPKPDTPPKLNVLAFGDHSGYCKNFFANAPEGRISMKKAVWSRNTLSVVILVVAISKSPPDRGRWWRTITPSPKRMSRS